MSLHPHRPAFWGRKLSLAGAVLTGALLLSAPAGAEPKPVPPPAIAGIPALPGPVAAPSVPADNVKVLKAAPDIAPAGAGFVLSGAGLAAGKDVSIVWSTASISYVLDPKLDSVDYVGRKVDKFGVVLARAKTSAAGAFSLELKVPRDFGGIHDILAVIDGVQVAKGGFLLERTVKISPAKGPVGTPITVRVSGMGSPTYESVGGVLYDNRYVGAVAANTTRGEATFQIRASGDVGDHWIEYGGSSHTVPYLNMQQSPVPWTDAHRLKFTVTKGSAVPPTRIDWPAPVKPTIDARTTLAPMSLSAGTAASAQLDSSSGAILSKVNVSAAGLTPNAKVDLVWSTVVGNRVNCTGTCWNFVSVPLGTATATADGSLKSPITVPDGLGGWHAVQLLQDGQIKAQVPYFVKRSLVSVPKVVKAGEPFTVRLKGVGWTQIDNTVAVTYDNGYIGYACGFNSNGDVVIQLFATGGPGIHLIDIYPLLYTQQPAYPYPQLGMVPLLSFAQDAPGLALGYELPAFRLAITVVA